MRSPASENIDLPTNNTRLRLEDLERSLAHQQAKNDQVLDALNTTLRLLASMTQNQALPPTATTSAVKTRNDLKPSPPPNFDGDRHKGRGFINACQAYFRLRPDNFPDEQTKIQWAMTYMNQGRAQKWANRVYHWEAIPANVRNPHFVNWDDFRSHFRTEFFPLHSDAVATNKLEGTTYFQKRRPVDDYLDDFRDLITESGYTDPKTIVVKFRRGLDPAIADAVATMATGRPDDLDPEAWYQAAIRFDQNQAANAAFRSAHFTAPQQKTVPAAPAVRTHPVAHPSRANFTPRFAHTLPTPGNPVPMDIDLTRRSGRPPPSCFRCGKLGHMAPDCPLPMDIRSMNREEAELFMGLFSARMDEIDLVTTAAAPEDEIPDERDTGFPSSNE